MYQVGDSVAVWVNDTNVGEGTILAAARNDSGIIYKVESPELLPRWWSAKQVFEIVALAPPTPK